MSNNFTKDGLHVLTNDSGKNLDPVLEAVLQGVNTLNAAVSSISVLVSQITAQFIPRLDTVSDVASTAVEALKEINITIMSGIGVLQTNLPELWSRVDSIIQLAQFINDVTIPGAYDRIDQVTAFLTDSVSPALKSFSDFVSDIETIGNNWIDKVDGLEITKKVDEVLKKITDQKLIEKCANFISGIEETGNKWIKKIDDLEIIKSSNAVLKKLVEEQEDAPSLMQSINNFLIKADALMKSIQDNSLIKRMSDFLEQATVFLGAIRNIWNYWEGVFSGESKPKDTKGTSHELTSSSTSSSTTSSSGGDRSQGGTTHEWSSSSTPDSQKNRKSVPAFASGGIVSGPTVAMVGEYAGARNNPEVIAPLSKLKGMLDAGGGQDYVVSALYDIADKLEAVIERSGNIYLDSDKVGEKLLEPMRRAQRRRGNAVLAL